MLSEIRLIKKSTYYMIQYQILGNASLCIVTESKSMLAWGMVLGSMWCGQWERDNKGA